MFSPIFLTATVATEPDIDLRSIKTALEGLDPAALLPDMASVFGSIARVCTWAVMAGPVLLLILGLAYLFLAPREANYYFGFRCYYGMGSVQAWQFTQRLAGLVLGGAGLVLTVVMGLISRSFATMDVTALAWRAVSCLTWELAISLLATAAIHIAAAMCFDRKGNLRKKHRNG